MVIFAYIVMATIDYSYQKYNWKQGLMMSKDEIKQEYKESEGDGQIKSKLKQIHPEMMEEEPAQRTKQSSAVVTNPEHMAVALLYNFDEPIFPLPIVLAKGIGVVAEKMIEVAKAEGIPVIRNVPLAHALMDTSQLMRYIPKELIAPVAEVLRYVKDLRDKKHIEEQLPSR
jgi:type III secretion protein U